MYYFETSRGYQPQVFHFRNEFDFCVKYSAQVIDKIILFKILNLWLDLFYE